MVFVLFANPPPPILQMVKTTQSVAIIQTNLFQLYSMRKNCIQIQLKTKKSSFWVLSPLPFTSLALGSPSDGNRKDFHNQSSVSHE